MSDSVRLEQDNQGGKKALFFIIGLLLGLLVAGLVAAAKDSKHEEGDSHSSNGSSNSSMQVNTAPGASLIAAEDQPSARTLLVQYSQLLVEASREGVDIPSEEATASKAALEESTNKLATALKANDQMKADLAAINSTLLEYAGTAKTGDNHEAVDKAFAGFSQNVQKQYKVDNSQEFDSQVTSVKNSLLEGIRDFVKNDYKGSYAKQLQAETEIAKLFSQLKNK